MEDEERDIRMSYMVKEEGVCDVTVKGGMSLLKPLYCLGCQLGGDKPLNLTQMIDHLRLIHIPTGDKVFPKGLERLERNVNSYNEYKRAVAKEMKEEDERKKMKKTMREVSA